MKLSLRSQGVKEFFLGCPPLLLNSLAMKKFPSPGTVSKESRSQGVKEFFRISSFTPKLLSYKKVSVARNYL